MFVHVRYNSWYISLPSSAKQQREIKWPNSALPGEREPQRLVVLNFYFKFIVVSQIQFRHNFDSDKENKWL